jgi:hypothetical protein
MADLFVAHEVDQRCAFYRASAQGPQIFKGERDMTAQHRAVPRHRSSSPYSGRVAEVLLKCYGRSYCEELGIAIERNTPSVLFRWLCATMLFSIRISANLAVRGAKALTEQGWTTPEKMLAASWEERTRVLNQSGYARYDESTSTKLVAASELLINEFGGDLRQLRERARRDPAKEHGLIQMFKGIGPVGADIFCREVQAAWGELYPFVDRLALESAKRLRIPATAQDLARLTKQEQFPRLLAALVRVQLAGAHAEIREQAALEEK